MVYIAQFLFITALSLAPVVATAASQGLTQADLDDLKVIANRKGVMQLTYDQDKRIFKNFESGYLTPFFGFLKSRDHKDILSRLEDLASRVEQGYWHSAFQDTDTYHLIRRAYSSLSSLYSLSKLDPHQDPEKQSEFAKRFSGVLVRLFNALVHIETNADKSMVYKPLPWFGEQGADIEENEEKLGLNYLDMGQKGLFEINAALRDIGNSETRIDRAMLFYPKTKSIIERIKSFFGFGTSPLPGLKNESDSNKRFAIFILHGTWSAGKEYKDESHLLFQRTKFMAQTLANGLDSNVEIYSFGWSGANDNGARMVAGEELANFVRTYFPKDEYHDIYVGHSHGGNVALHCAKTLGDYQTPHMIITLATPIRKDFMTDNVNLLLQFYTDSDLVQYFGAFELLTARNKSGTGDHWQNPRMFTRNDIQKLGLFDDNDRHDKTRIYATRVSIAGAPILGRLQSHYDMKHLISILPSVMEKIIAFPAHSHLELDLHSNLSEGSLVKQPEFAIFKLQEATP
jgi:hypothetical protein